MARLKWGSELEPFGEIVLKAYNEIIGAIAALSVEEQEVLWDAARDPSVRKRGWYINDAAEYVRMALPADRSHIRVLAELEQDQRDVLPVKR